MIEATHSAHHCTRRKFLRLGATLAAGAPLAGLSRAFGRQNPLSNETKSRAAVAIVSCKTYGPEVKAALRQCFDLVGGVDKLVRNKTVTVKINLTGTDFTPWLGRPVGETFMTHGGRSGRCWRCCLTPARRGCAWSNPHRARTICKRPWELPDGMSTR